MISDQKMPGKLEDATNTEELHRNEICRIGRWMYERGLIVAHEGNLSVRLDEVRILITPKGACKGTLAPEDLLIIDSDGLVLSGHGQPSSETPMHLSFYQLRHDAQAICHAHPPEATGFAVAGRPLEEAILPEVVVGLGKVPVAPYATPGTQALCAALEPFIPYHSAILLQNHGVVTCGGDLRTAYFRLEIVEHFARILLTAEALGGPRLLTRLEVHKLLTSDVGTASAPEHQVLLPRAAEEWEGRLTFSRHELESLVEQAILKDRAQRQLN